MTSHLGIRLDFTQMMSGSLAFAGICDEEIDALLPQAEQILKGLEDLRRLGQLPFRDLPYHEELAKEILQKARETKGEFETLLFLGVGGSMLGPRFLVNSLAPRERFRFVPCDTVDPFSWREIRGKLDFKKTLLVVASKSGKTLETLAAFLYFRGELERELGGRWKNHCLVITGLREGEGSLRKMAVENEIRRFEIPPGVGGRFSVLTAVGLFPASFVGVEIQELLAGARLMDERCKKRDPWLNPAVMSALLHYLYDTKKRRRIRVVMPYGERLRDYSPWFVQLWAESLGKRVSLKGKEIFGGSTPVAAFGPQDQHAQLQLYLEGPQDKTVTFVAADYQKEEEISLPKDFTELEEFSRLGGRAAGDLLRAERLATEKALVDQRRPNQSILLGEMTPGSVGQLLYMAEVETVFAGELYNLNPFDQPAVEAIKKNVRDYLSGKISEMRDRTYII